MFAPKPLILLSVSCLAASLLSAKAPAQAPVTFEGKTLSMLVDSHAGGGTDLTGRLLVPFLKKYLPGNPSIVVKNMPGAGGTIALNYFVQQVKPDGLTLLTGGGPSIDPIRYRAPQSHFDPGKFEYIGGIGRGGSMLVVRSAAEKRLYDKSAAPVTVGIAGVAPNSGQLMAAWGREFLGWNLKWVAGYRSTGATMHALQQGEIDMTATSNLFALKNVMTEGTIKAVVQSGGLENGKRVPRPEFSHVPMLADALAGKINDPMAKKAVATWQAVLLTDKFVALPPGTPQPIIEVYRAAYRQVMADPEFNSRGRKLSEVFEPISAQDLNVLIKDIVETPKAATQFLLDMLHRQGIHG